MTDLSKPTNKMKQNDTMKKQRIAVYYSLLWILVKESTQMNTKGKTSYLQSNCCGSLEVINTQRKEPVQKITIAELLSRVQKTQKIVDCGRLSTQKAQMKF